MNRMIAIVALIAGTACQGGRIDMTPDDTGEEMSSDVVEDPDNDGPCGGFQPAPTEWGILPLGGGDWSISTVVEVEGAEDCFLFPGVAEETYLELHWDSGDIHAAHRLGDGYDHSGFGPRDCNDGRCEIGDLFEVRAIYPGYPVQNELDALLDALGPPDSACGVVANADGRVEDHCDRL